MIKQIPVSFLFLSLGMGLSRVMILLLFLVASSILSVGEFSSLSMLFFSGAFLTYIFTFGLNIGLLKYSSNIEKLSEAECLAVCRYAFKVINCVLFLVFLIALSFGWLEKLVEYDTELFGSEMRLYGLIVFVILAIYKLQCVSILTGLKEFKSLFFTYALESAFLLPGLWAAKTVEDIFLFLCLSSLAACTYLAYKVNNINGKIVVDFKLIKKKFPIIIKFSSSFYLAGLGSMAAMWISQAVFFSSSIDLQEFARFSFAYRVYTPFIFIFTVFSTVLIPYIVNQNSEQKHQVQNFIVYPIILIFVLGMISASCVYILYGQAAVYFDLKYKDLAEILGILILASSVQGASKIMVNKMIADSNSNGNLVGEALFSITLLSSLFVYWTNDILTARLFALTIMCAYVVSCIGYAILIRQKYRLITGKKH